MEINPDEPETRRTQKIHVLPLNQRLAYSVGHVLNDLCSALWFSYLLVYMGSILGFSNAQAGLLLLIGQIADGLATPFVGIQSDKQHTFILCRYGRRKAWHLLGTTCVLMSFPLVFNTCLGCENAHEDAKAVYYASFIIIFQFGWAAVQISHLSLIPDLTPISSERIELNAYRYSLTVGSNIAVYVITWLVLHISSNEGDKQIGPDDAEHFTTIVITVLLIGFVFSFIFHIILKEKETLFDLNGDAINVCNIRKPLSCGTIIFRWQNWFKVSAFYKVGVLYMCTRLVINLTQVYTPLYLQKTLHLHRESIAYIPLVMYCSGFLASFFIKYLNSKVGKKFAYLIGCIVALTGYIWLYFGEGDNYNRYQIYGVSVLLGISGSAMLITSLGITNDLIGDNTANGAFVFGAMSFLDKISNGVAVMILQAIHPEEKCVDICHTDFYRIAISITCGAATICGILIIFFIPNMSDAFPTENNTNSTNCVQEVESDEECLIDPRKALLSKSPTDQMNVI